MEKLLFLGNAIKEKRLALNLRMDDLAKKANITRSTLWSIEKGSANCSIGSIIKLLDILNLDLNLVDKVQTSNQRVRATRVNTALDKKINRFVIMCVEQYALHTSKGSEAIYKEMLKKGVISELENDYEDLHGMSTVYLNDYIESILKRNGDEAR